MSKSKLNLLILSLPAVAVLFPYSMANAALRINNSSMVREQAQLNAARSAEAMYANMGPQPARVVTNDNGETVTVSNENMNTYTSIYPNGQFDWVVPTTGRNRGGPATCAALIELRAYQNSAGTAYTTLATAYLAAGDSMKCNIDDFHDITPQGREFEYPADNAPTIEDVEKVMAQENKSGAGFKILAAAVVGGLGGNLIGKGEAGSESPLGVNKDKLKTTAIGAAAGAALMTASTQVNDYKTGSIILSTGVNAAAGAAAGNLMASGDDVLKIEPCKVYNKDDQGKEVEVTTYCIRGAVELDSNRNAKEVKDPGLFLNVDNRYTYKCEKVEDTDEWKGCYYYPLTQIKLSGVSDPKCAPQGYITESCVTDVLKPQILGKTLSAYNYDDPEKHPDVLKYKRDGSGVYIKIESGREAGTRTGAMIEVTEADAKKFFGYKYSKWPELKKALADKPIRDLQGKQFEKKVSIDSFYPAAQSADDGSMIDFNNKARTKSTLIGTGGGAALGALSGAAGANSEIQERWTAAVREYEDSLRNISCSTGNRYLSGYNTVVIIPDMTKSE